jgi:nucleoside-diphosphate-sugar epimerase
VRVVVTGSTGFLGRHLVTSLHAHGHSVTGLDRRAAAHEVGHFVGVELTALCRDARRALREADAVVHLAGCPGVRDTTADVGRRRYRDNVGSLRSVLGAVPVGVPLVVASSSSVYGGSVGGRASAENDALAPRGGYARSKVLAEALCADAARRGAEVTVVRPFTVVGEGQRPDMALHRWVGAALRGEPLTVLGSLDRTRDLTDVRCVVAALAALAAISPGGAVNLGTGRPVTLREMVEAVGVVTGAEPSVREVAADPDEVPDTRADVSRLVQLTGVQPVTDLLDVVGRVRDDFTSGADHRVDLTRRAQPVSP